MIIWNEIDTVLLDMDGTLLDLHFDNYFWQEYLPLKWAELNNMDIGTAKSTLMPGFSSREGTLSWYCLDHWSAHLGIDILKLKEDVGHLICERPSALEFLGYLAAAGKQKALVTNAHQNLIEMKFNCTALGQHLDHVFCAHHFGFPKEDLKFWDELQAVFPFNPERTLLIDDNHSVLNSAKSYGIKHLLTIAQPDSRQPRRVGGEFVAIDSFLDISV
jgi:HAD superfamily hydrolase (TIGR01509 family)